MKIKLTDGIIIVAVLPTPMAKPVEAGSIVHMAGIVENRNKFKPSFVRLIPPATDGSDLDDALWNELVAAMIENQDVAYDKFDDAVEHFGVDDVAPDGSNADIIPFPDQDSSHALNGKSAGDDFPDFDQGIDEHF